ncbi:MAG: hypothetical protein JSS89_12275 [Bacteroidetes bacterium]|nr:hypothetical protein [Bacteroidota bacterium]
MTATQQSGQCASPELVRLVTNEANRVASEHAGFNVTIYNETDVRAVLSTFITLRDRRAPFTTADVEHYSARDGRIVAAALSAYMTVTMPETADAKQNASNSWVDEGKNQTPGAATKDVPQTSTSIPTGVRIGIGFGLFAVVMAVVYKVLPR